MRGNIGYMFVEEWENIISLLAAHSRSSNPILVKSVALASRTPQSRAHVTLSWSLCLNFI